MSSKFANKNSFTFFTTVPVILYRLVVDFFG